MSNNPVKRIPTLFPLLLLLAAADPVQSAQEKEKMQSADRKPKPIQFVEYDLPNGLHVILHQERSVPVIATYVLYHVGSKNERADRTGFAHFFEHLMFEGSRNIPRGEIDKLVSGAGGNLNASTSFDSTQYYLNLPSNQLKLALWIESERMLQAQVEEVGVETQREVVKEERRMRYDNSPFGTVFLDLADLVFKGTPYEWTPIGSFQYIDQAQIDEFRDFYKKFYIPNNATLAVAGDFDIDEAKKLIAEYFGPIPRGEDIERPDFQWPPEKLPEERERTVSLTSTPLPATLHAWPGPDETSDDAYALELLAMILGQGDSSRLHRHLVVEEEAAYSASPYPVFLEKGGLFGVFVVGNRGEKISRLDDLLSAEIADVRKNGVTKKELRKALNQKETEVAAAFGSVQKRAESLANYHVLYGDTSLINTEIERYRKVTPERIRKAAEKYLGDDRLFVLHYPVVEKKPAPQSTSEQEEGE